MALNPHVESKFSSNVTRQSARARMPEELWRRIFEDVLEEKRASFVILPVLLVCKTWKVAGLRLLYRYLGFSKATSLDSFHLHLLSEAAKERYPALSSRAIIVHTDSVLLSAAMPQVVRYTRNLTSFSAATMYARAPVLENLSCIAKHTLKELTLRLCAHTLEGALNLDLVGRFTGLERLAIGAQCEHVGVDPLPTNPLSRLPGFRMESLTELSLCSPAKRPIGEGEILIFLSRCEMPNLTTLNLHLPRIDEDPTWTLRRCFQKFGPQLRRLVLNVPGGVVPAQHLFPFLTSLKQVELPGKQLPALGSIPTLLPSVEHLIFPIDLNTERGTMPIYLDNLKNEFPKHSALRFLQVSKIDGKPFDWSTIALVDASVAGQLFSRSIGLATKGIQMLDNYGNTITMTSCGQSWNGTL